MEVLLLNLHARDICCHLGGVFATYMALIFNSYESIRLYVALSDSPLYSFRLGDAEKFMLEGFEFVLLDQQVESDRTTNSRFVYTFGALIPSSRAGQNQPWISYTSCGTIRMTFPS